MRYFEGSVDILTGKMRSDVEKLHDGRVQRTEWGSRVDVEICLGNGGADTGYPRGLTSDNYLSHYWGD